MSKMNSHSELQGKLTRLLTDKFPGITVEVAHGERWGRTMLTFRWSGFDDLLPEERFHRLFRIIPEDFYEKHLRGCVWFELGSTESVEAFLKLPRSEDVQGKERQVIQRLTKVKFFASLMEELGADPMAACAGDFSTTRRILAARRFGKTALRNTLLVLMRNGAYCDCEALFNAKLLQLGRETP
ncbi:MAG: DUF2695 domain-containing protein [Phycisphaerae bacterium]|nr:DUF2695 domain-containing protein [Phycisphaerae bacterium]